MQCRGSFARVSRTVQRIDLDSHEREGSNLYVTMIIGPSFPRKPEPRVRTAAALPE